jgi:FK506-binding protein 1
MATTETVTSRATTSSSSSTRPPQHITTSTGVVITVIQPGDGLHFPQKGCLIRMHYNASLLLDGIESPPFDSSHARNEPLTVRVGTSQLVAGLDDALPLISKGELCKIKVPPGRAYGSRGYPPIVPSEAVIIYEIHLLAIDIV